MKRVILLASLVVCAFGYSTGIQITASGGSPIPASFSESNSQSRVQECLGNVVEILNQTSSVLAVGFGTSAVVPSFDYTFVPGGPASGHSIKPQGGLSRGTYVYLRSAGSAITSGTVQVSCYFEQEVK